MHLPILESKRWNQAMPIDSFADSIVSILYKIERLNEEDERVHGALTVLSVIKTEELVRRSAFQKKSDLYYQDLFQVLTLLYFTKTL